MSSPMVTRSVSAKYAQSHGHLESKTEEQSSSNDKDTGCQLGASDYTNREDETDFGKLESWQTNLKKMPETKQNKKSKDSIGDDKDDLDSGKTKTRKRLERLSQYPANEYSTSKKNEEMKSSVGSTSYHIICKTCICVVALAVLLFYFNFAKGKYAMTVEEKQEKFLSKLNELKSKFPSQNERFWNVIAAAPMSHLKFSEVDRPVVVLLASQPGAESMTKCIADDIAEMYTVGLVGSLHDVVSINGSHYMTAELDYTKREIDSALIKGFEGYSKAAIVHRFDQLPACTALLFHSYCENDNAPYKNVAIVLSVVLNETVTMDNKEIERHINYHLEKSWSSCPDFQEKGKVEAMLSRVANNIALVGEEERVCND